MMKSLALGAVLGGVVAFIWSAASWMVMPWHNSTMNSFTNEDAVAQVLLENAPTSGMYWLPGLPPNYDTMPAEQKKAADAAMQEKMKTSPFLYGVVLRRWQENMARSMTYGLLFDILAALLISMLVLKTSGMSYAGRVMFIVTVALAVGVIAVLPNWVWWHFPTRWTLVTMADLVVGWLLAGLVIAKVAAPKAA
jgi:hypothetical protein